MKMKKCISMLLTVSMCLVLLAGLVPAKAESEAQGVTKNPNEGLIFAYLTEVMGFNNAVASGILANIQRESNFDPHATGDRGTSYGICQWHNSRWDDLKNYCDKNGLDWQTLDGQLHFLEYELNAKYKSLVRNLSTLHNTDYGAYRAAYCWCYQFEVPSGYNTGNSEKRGIFARDTYWPVYRGNDYTETTDWTETYPAGVPEEQVEIWEEYRTKDYVTAKTTDPNDKAYAGWDFLGSDWEVTKQGSVRYVKNWPAGFDKSSELYKTYAVSPVKEENSSTRRVTATYANGGWLCYHWCDGKREAVSAQKSGNCTVFHALESTTAPTELPPSSKGDGSVKLPEQDACGCSAWFYPVEITEQSYTEESFLYTFGHWGDWSGWLDVMLKKADKYEPSDTRQGERRTRYRTLVKPETAVDFLRLSGDNRVQTAIAISRASYDRADTVVLASGNAFPDALSGGVLAYALQAPVLLVRDHLESDIRAEIKRLGASKVYILGGEGAISKGIEADVKKLAQAERIAGANRYETSIMIAEKLEELTGNKPHAVFFVSANDKSYPDAISVSAVAAVLGSPILYIAPNGQLNEQTLHYLATHNIERATIVGGPGAVSEQAEINLKAVGIPKEERLAGQNRYDTCLAILEKYAYLYKGDMVTAATGSNYPDALTGGMYAAINRAPMLLVGNSLTKEQQAYLKAFGGQKLTVFGGEGAVSDAVAVAIRRAMAGH